MKTELNKDKLIAVLILAVLFLISLFWVAECKAATRYIFIPVKMETPTETILFFVNDGSEDHGNE